MPLNEEITAAFFDEQPQPAFWMQPVWDDAQAIVDFEYIYCNKEFYHYTGVPRELILGARLSASPLVKGEEVRKKLFDQMVHVYQSGERMHDRLYNENLNRYYSFTRSLIKGGILTVLQDRTEEMAIIKQLEEQTAFTQSLLQQSANGITVSEVIRDHSGNVVDGRTILSNDAAEQYLLIPKGEYLTKTIAQLDPGIMSSPLYAMSLKTLESGEPFYTSTLR